MTNAQKTANGQTRKLLDSDTHPHPAPPDGFGEAVDERPEDSKQTYKETPDSDKKPPAEWMEEDTPPPPLPPLPQEETEDRAHSVLSANVSPRLVHFELKERDADSSGSQSSLGGGGLH